MSDGAPQQEVYLGDGLYASFDSFSFWLRAPREGGDHVVALEPSVLDAFARFIKKCGGTFSKGDNVD